MVIPQSGIITFVVLAPIGLKRHSGHLLAVPWSALNLDLDQRVFLLDINRESLELAPAFHEEHWPDFGDQRWTSEIDNFYRTCMKAAA